MMNKAVRIQNLVVLMDNDNDTLVLSTEEGTVLLRTSAELSNLQHLSKTLINFVSQSRKNRIRTITIMIENNYIVFVPFDHGFMLNTTRMSKKIFDKAMAWIFKHPMYPETPCDDFLGSSSALTNEVIHYEIPFKEFRYHALYWNEEINKDYPTADAALQYLVKDYEKRYLESMGW